MLTYPGLSSRVGVGGPEFQLTDASVIRAASDASSTKGTADPYL